jgi:hypothetical protein
LIYPAAGVVDIYQDLVFIARLQRCIPESVERFYRTQLLAATEETTSQRSLLLTSDAFFAENGDVLVIGPIRDSDGRYHIDRFGSEGRPLGSTVILADAAHLLADVRFGATDRDLIGFTSEGEMVYARVRSWDGR